MRQEQPEQARYIVTALRRGLAVLHLFRRDRRVVSVPEIEAELDLSRATAFRTAYTLERDGYLQRLPGSHAFRLGPKVLTLGFDYLHSTEVVACGRDVLDALRDRTGLSAHMGVRDGTDAVYVLLSPSLHRLRGDIPVGTRYPCHAVSCGRALLLDMDASDLAALYDGVELQAYSDQTPTTLVALATRLQAERAQGYVCYRSGFVAGIASLAAPVRDAGGGIVAAINVSDSESVPAMAELETTVRDHVLRAGAEVSARLGWRG